jgi:hypothetical protein
LNLPKTPADDDSFSFFRVITGLGLTEPPPRQQMFNLELAQRLLMNPDLQKIVPDPVASVSEEDIRKFMKSSFRTKKRLWRCGGTSRAGMRLYPARKYRVRRLKLFPL